MYIKRFDEWNTLKKKIEENTNLPYCHEGELRWSYIGENLGMEICGKGPCFTRPVYVLGILGRNLALVIPVTTVFHKGRHFYKIVFKGVEQYLCFNQIKVISTKRLGARIGTAGTQLQNEIKKIFTELFGIK